MKKAVIYTRLSVENATHMKQQVDLCQAKAQSLGVVVERVFSEVSKPVEGTMDQQLTAAINHCVDNPIAYFICADAGRLSRYESDFKDWVGRIENTGAAIEFVRNHPADR